jgi:hypothetical protein
MTTAKTPVTPSASITAAFTDLAAFDTAAAGEKGAEFELKNPVNGKGLGIFITVLGKHGKTFRDHVAETTDDRIREQALNDKMGKETPAPSAEEIENRAVALLVLCTVSWRSETRNDKGEVTATEPYIVIAGEKLDCTVTNARKLYKQFIWLREQVDAAVGNLELFIQA